MELKRLFIVIRKRLDFIVCIPIIVVVIATIVSLGFIPPVYEASSTLYIINQRQGSGTLVTYEEILANQNLVKDYRELIKSKYITTAALDKLGITDITPTMLSQRISVSAKNDTRVLEIKVTDGDPQRAMDLTNSVCEVFLEKSKSLMNFSNVRIIDEAQKPEKPIKPNTLLNVALSFLASLLLTLGSLYVLEVISETIKTSDDIETYLDLSVLGIIPSFQIK